MKHKRFRRICNGHVLARYLAREGVRDEPHAEALDPRGLFRVSLRFRRPDEPPEPTVFSMSMSRYRAANPSRNRPECGKRGRMRDIALGRSTLP